MARKTGSLSFSVPDGFEADLDARAKQHGFKNRSEYLRALYEADKFYRLRPALSDTVERVLRLPEVEGHARGDRPVGKSAK